MGSIHSLGTLLGSGSWAQMNQGSIHCTDVLEFWVYTCTAQCFYHNLCSHSLFLPGHTHRAGSQRPCLQCPDCNSRQRKYHSFVPGHSLCICTGHQRYCIQSCCLLFPPQYSCTYACIRLHQNRYDPKRRSQEHTQSTGVQPRWACRGTDQWWSHMSGWLTPAHCTHRIHIPWSCSSKGWNSLLHMSHS